MTTSDDKRGPSRATVVILLIVAVVLALLPAFRSSGAVLAHGGFPVDCSDTRTMDACRY